MLAPLFPLSLGRNGAFKSLLDSIPPGPSPKGAPVVMTECGFRGSGQEGRPRLFQNPGRAGPGREPEPGRVILGLAEKSSKGRARVSELPRAGGGEVGGAEAGK